MRGRATVVLAVMVGGFGLLLVGVWIGSNLTWDPADSSVVASIAATGGVRFRRVCLDEDAAGRHLVEVALRADSDGAAYLTSARNDAGIPEREGDGTFSREELVERALALQREAQIQLLLEARAIASARRYPGDDPMRVVSDPIDLVPECYMLHVVASDDPFGGQVVARLRALR